MPAFERYIGIDYSGAETAESSLPGLRVYEAHAGEAPFEVLPPPSPRKYWTRREAAEWLERELAAGPCALIGIGHGFSFPLRYFEAHGLPRDWDAFLEDFQRHWPTDERHLYVDFVRDGLRGNGAARSGDPHWRRLAEVRARARSVFQFDGPRSVAKSTHAGLPWLLHLRRATRGRVHFWPFDGWRIPAGRSAVAEVYPAMWSRDFAREGRTPDQHDAYSIARWLQLADRGETLPRYLCPEVSDTERRAAAIEGWILGLM
ncbi:MAG: hypothetical protein KGN36_12445 [Acidobacteriota bacterium]|nr:hypothetical protein [Acidobacteriota bacterium]